MRSKRFMQMFDLWLARSELDVCADGARELALFEATEAIEATSEVEARAAAVQQTHQTQQRSRPGVGQTPDGCASKRVGTSNQSNVVNEPLRA